MSKFERATQRPVVRASKVTLDGKPINIANFDPVVFARSLANRRRKKPKTHADRLAELEAAERKLGIR